MNKQTLQAIIDDLKAGRTPSLTTQDVPAFSEEATAGNDHLSPADLDIIAASLTEADIPTFERALRASEEGELAWLGFKVVYNPEVAVAKSGIGFTKDYGEVGSADGEPLVFFCNDAKEIVCSREPSPRDLFQMKDVTRGPSMHNAQFEGLTWASVALFDPIRVWLLGASDVAVELVPLAQKVGFEAIAVDYDPAYLNADRFPDAHRVLLEGQGFDALFDLHARPEDYVCVLTRGHMHDPESCIWAAREGVHYIGMMGCKGKNDG
ncbi:MAG: XdhC family protein, partial [Eggerthellaceae bacterium]|nr:XdhC family protein [Eggerthellaceae bacterium]